MADGKSQEIKIENDVILKTTIANEDIKIETEEAGTDVVCHEIKVEIKEEPNDSSEEDAIVAQDIQHFPKLVPSVYFQCCAFSVTEDLRQCWQYLWCNVLKVVVYTAA